MTEGVLTALIGVAGSALGSLIGIVTSSKLTQYRLEALEKRVEAHNRVIERTYRLEERADLIEERQKVANHRIDDLERNERGNERQ